MISQARRVFYLLLLILEIKAESAFSENIASGTCITGTCDDVYSIAKSESEVNVDSKSEVDVNSKTKESMATCSLYLAKSSVPNGGLGVYSMFDIPEGGKVGNPDIVIPIIDKNLGGLLSQYTWRGSDHTTHNEGEKVDNLCPGIQALVNGHEGLSNIFGGSQVANDGAGLHRSKNPGAGAFTRYHNLQTIASSPIQAGMELFIEYGDDWYFTRKQFKNTPRFYHYDRADRMLKKFSDMLKQDDVSRDSAKTFWDFTRSNNDDATNSILPSSIDEIEKAAEVGSARYNAPKDFIRSPEWLATEGMCLDNLREGRSTIPEAGRGAFATRLLPKGSVVSPAPLIHTCNEEDYSFHDQEQLLLNYCFGHRSSSIILCPYGPANSLINHSSEKANAELRWSDSKFNSKEWLEKSAQEVCSERGRGLMFDIVAKRDILPGEEVLLHYGQEWEDAWNAYVEDWESPFDSEYYISASELNETESILATFVDNEDFRYPENVFTQCLISFNDDDFPEDGNTEKVYHKVYDGYESNFDLINCVLIRKEFVNEKYFYKVALRMTEDDVNFFKVFVYGVPREAIKFSDRPYSSDMFMEDAFRHEIMIPDEIFPESWKDFDN